VTKKLHLGCWHRHIPGFTHIDLFDLPHIDHVASIDSLPFINDQSIDLIYCSHALEYFDRQESIDVLSEWYRILLPGGILRIAVPDFEARIKVYSDTKDLNAILGPLYGRMNGGDIESNSWIYHKTVYDEASLKKILTECGFVDPIRWDWRRTEHSQVDDHSQAYFPHMDKQNGLLVSLNIEARRPL
jgi:predicted SAM-dependent methyltransferase